MINMTKNRFLRGGGKNTLALRIGLKEIKEKKKGKKGKICRFELGP